MFGAAVKRLFDHGPLTVYQLDDWSYKIDLLTMNANKDQFIFAKLTYLPIRIEGNQNGSISPWATKLHTYF
jgi:hypothetical protein